MARRRHGAEQIVRKLREAEVELAVGTTVQEACRKLEITEHGEQNAPADATRRACQPLLRPALTWYSVGAIVAQTLAKLRLME